MSTSAPAPAETAAWEPAGPIGDALAKEAFNPRPAGDPVEAPQPTSATAEIAAMQAAYETLAPLDDPTRQRILSFLNTRLG